MVEWSVLLLIRMFVKSILECYYVVNKYVWGGEYFVWGEVGGGGFWNKVYVVCLYVNWLYEIDLKMSFMFWLYGKKVKRC